MSLFGAILGVGASLLGMNSQKKAAKSAADASVQGQMAAIEEQRRQFDAIQKLLAPYVQGGQEAFGQQMGLMGLKGAEEQQKQLSMIQNSPEFAEMTRQGEQGILANAAATGGLRGGNTQSALAQFRPQVLNQLVAQKLGQYGGVANAGLGAAQNTGQFGANSAANIGQLQQGMGSTMGNAQLAMGGINANMYNQLAGGLGQIAGGLNLGGKTPDFNMIGGNPF
jgi:hypothetical protein